MCLHVWFYNVFHLTLTSVVFELFDMDEAGRKAVDLTLTSVVFEFVPLLNKISDTI